MKIALLGPANSIHLQRWAAALAERGHAVAVVSQQRCDPDCYPAAVRRVELPRGGAFGYFANAWPLRRFVRDWRPDVLNAHYASGYGTTAALASFGAPGSPASSCPTLLSVWGSDVYEFPYQGALKGWLLRRNLRAATALASTSHAMAQQVLRLVPEVQAIAVTPFGVDLARFAAVAAPRPPGAGLTLGIVKTLAPQYGVDLLLHAFAGLLADAEVTAVEPRLSLLIVGDGPQRAALEALARQLGIAARTQFTGGVGHADVPQWLRRLDIYVAPSRLESFGVAVIEASACGLPVVVSDAGGLPEVVRDGETGLVVPHGDAAALQAALKRLVLDPGLRAELGRRGRAHVEREYEWGHCVDRMEQCYARTIARAGRR